MFFLPVFSATIFPQTADYSFRRSPKDERTTGKEITGARLFRGRMSFFSASEVATVTCMAL